MNILNISTTAYSDQKPGTSGLRKRTKVFEQEHYLANFIQSIFNSFDSEKLKGTTWLVSGDGRYFSKESFQIICEIAAANGIRRVWTGIRGLCSTPAASVIIRQRENGIAFGGILMTASHNPGGKNGDFGIKLNLSNGGPAPDAVTDRVYELSKIITHYKKCTLPLIDLNTLGVVEIIPNQFEVAVIDTVEDWMKLMMSIFDFCSIKKLIERPDFSMKIDGMSGVAGHYTKRLFCDELHAKPSSLICCDPLPDFGGDHPDPNLIYAARLCNEMKVFNPNEVTSDTAAFAAALDGDADRHMILGAGFFVCPSDSIAIIAYYAQKCIPFFKNGLKGIARSMPTSQAVDKVASDLGISLYETPTGWKYFGNLMDAQMISLCGEESFGSSSDHIREKDGLWAVLVWMSILSYLNTDSNKPMVTVQQCVEDFWRKFGRSFYCRYDFEEVPKESADAMMSHLNNIISQMQKPENSFETLMSPGLYQNLIANGLHLVSADNFSYTDPVDGSVAKDQGVRVFFSDTSRITWRLSGTGSHGATIRIYLERYIQDPVQAVDLAQEKAVQPLVDFALEFSQVCKYTGRTKPSVIT